MTGEPLSAPSPVGATTPTNTATVAAPAVADPIVGPDVTGTRTRAHQSIGLLTLGALTLTVGGAVTVVGTLWPWVASGRRYRSSYDIVQLVERLGFAPEGPMNLALRLWPLVPLLAVVSIVAAWWRRGVVASATGVAVGLYAGAVGVAVARDGPRTGLVRVVDGPQITAVGAAIMLLGAAITLADALRARRLRLAS